MLTPVPATMFLRRLSATIDSMGYNITPNLAYIDCSRAHRDKVPMATPIFSGSGFLVVVVLPMSRDVDV